MVAAIAKKDNPDYYDDCIALGKRKREGEIEEAAVPVEED